MLVEYLRYIGLDQSVKCLSIWPEACNEKHPELVQLLSSRKETPWFVGWCRTCPGLIINKVRQVSLFTRCGAHSIYSINISF
jgi:hypothetical protein